MDNACMCFNLFTFGIRIRLLFFLFSVWKPPRKPPFPIFNTMSPLWLLIAFYLHFSRLFCVFRFPPSSLLPHSWQLTIYRYIFDKCWLKSCTYRRGGWTTTSTSTTTAHRQTHRVELENAIRRIELNAIICVYIYIYSMYVCIYMLEVIFVPQKPA